MSAPVMMPRERPILMAAEMVRQTLADAKGQTRRIVKHDIMHRPNGALDAKWYIRARRDGVWDSYETLAELVARHCPYGAPGDRLWVRETWAPHEPYPDGLDDGSGPEIPYAEMSETLRAYWSRRVIHRATATPDEAHSVEKWRPSIFLPRWACRLTLDLLSVRVERVQAITDEDILAEGVTRELVAEMVRMPLGHIPTLRDAWRIGWTHINGAESWAANPWVWVVGFRRVEEHG